LGLDLCFFFSSSSSFYVIFMSFDVDSVCGELQLSYFGLRLCLLDMAWLFLTGQTDHVGLPDYFSCYNHVRPANQFS
jgi:hypothetical protein